MTTDGRQDDRLSAHPEWTRYCAFRETGLRRQAFDALHVFLDEAMAWPFDRRLEFALSVLQLGTDTPSNPLLTQPLYMGLLVPTLREWNVRESGNAQSHLWLGLLRQDNPSAHLERAIALDPGCEAAYRVLSEWICDDIRYNQHELPGFYIHDPRLDLDALDQVIGLCLPHMKRPWAVRWRRQAARLRKQAHGWLRFHPNPGDFAAY